MGAIDVPLTTTPMIGDRLVLQHVQSFVTAGSLTLPALSVRL